jgi:hypothetical protein
MGNKGSEYPKCKDTRVCFAKSEKGRCTILEKTYAQNYSCPFCKPFRDKDKYGNDYPPEMQERIKTFGKLRQIG